MKAPEPGNFISEWFGQRIYPQVVASAQGIATQRDQVCPFLTTVKGSTQGCVKNDKSKGVCTISSCSNGPRQDWVACPYRIIDPSLVTAVGTRLYGIPNSAQLFATAGPTLAEAKVRKAVQSRLAKGDSVLVYFDQKIGGELSVSGTSKSPEMAFDVTLVQLLKQGAKFTLGRFAILEVQTMDFHGSYGHAVAKLKNALELHPKAFPSILRENQWWAGDGIEGPNIANVFKRTFYQMIFKFGFSNAPSCAGTALTIPASVWDSWQPFLGGPSMHDHPDGTSRLNAPGAPSQPANVKGWIYVVDFDATSKTTPSPMRIVKTIGVTADQLAYLALKTAPEAAADQLLSATGIYSTLHKRLGQYWPGGLITP